MHLARTIAEVNRWRQEPGSVGFVPTMGALHAGHLALVARARRENDHVVVSLFVNPTQFGPSEDLARYPRNLDRDRELLESAGCDLLFAPEATEIYPDGFATTVDVGPVSRPLEGAARPSHFKGVAVVVLKLLNIVRPDRGYFGQKDAQQLAVIRRLVRDLNVQTEIIVVPTTREPDGLAMSSRNVYLSPEERKAAPALYRALQAGQALWASGERKGDRIRAAVEAVIRREPIIQIDYISLADAESLGEIDTVAAAPALLSLAAKLGSTRLIDNCLLD